MSELPIEMKMIAFGSKEHEEEIKLRYKILREPLGLHYTKEQLDAEIGEFHFGAFEKKTLLGCLLLKAVDKNEIKMRQVAVDVQSQGKGVGKALVHFSENFAVEKGFLLITLHARKSAVPFYKKLGYKIDGKEFTEVTLPHVAMKKQLIL